MTLIERLRAAAVEMSKWDPDLNPPFSRWSDLVDEAAEALTPTVWLVWERGYEGTLEGVYRNEADARRAAHRIFGIVNEVEVK